MTRGDRERLDDLAEAMRAIRAHMAATADELTRKDAILYNLLSVGEAAKRLGEATKSRRPEIPWREIAGLRDLLTHEYFRIDMAEITKILERDLSSLEKAVAALRRREERQ